MAKNTPYIDIAPYYDQLMSEIDYEYWADYLDGIIQEFHPEATSLFEWACGTGSLALSLNELDCYQITACDLSESMIKQAKLKAEDLEEPPHFFAQDMRKSLPNSHENSADMGLCVFDSLNYLVQLEEVDAYFQHAHNVIKPKGYILFDFITSAHCAENAIDFAYEEAFYGDIRLVRRATYPIQENLHQTQLDVYDGQDSTSLVFQEKHIQRPYTLAEIKAALGKANFEFIAAFGDFTDLAPKKNAKRITLIAQCLKT